MYNKSTITILLFILFISLGTINCKGLNGNSFLVDENTLEGSTSHNNNYESSIRATGSSTYMLMEYEAWFGPKASKWSSKINIFPTLSSSNMNAFGGGYDSKDERVIEQHYKWFLDMGIDGIVLDHTNNIACTFSPDTFYTEVIQIIYNKYIQNGRKMPLEYDYYFNTIGWKNTIVSFTKDSMGDQNLLNFLKASLGCQQGDVFQVAMETIKTNNANLFRLFDQFSKKYGKTIKIVVLAGGYEPTAWETLPSKSFSSGMDLQVQFYQNLYQKYPDLRLIHESKPLMISYYGAPTPVHLFSKFEEKFNNHRLKAMECFAS